MSQWLGRSRHVSRVLTSLDLSYQCTNLAASVESNHCFSTIGTYMNEYCSLMFFKYHFTGNIYTVYTEPDYNYERLKVYYPPSVNNYFVFRVRTCMDAFVGLKPLLESSDDYTFYEIVIGCYGNTYSDIRLPSEDMVVAHVDTPSILSCYSFRYSVYVGQ